MKGDYQKPLKKLTLFFLLNPVPFNVKSHKKQKGLGTSDHSLFRLQKFGGVIYSGSWVISKLTPANLCKPVHDIINHLTSICSFEYG